MVTRILVIDDTPALLDVFRLIFEAEALTLCCIFFTI